MHNNQKLILCLGFFLGLFFSAMFGCVWGHSVGLEQSKAIAATTECARYHPDTGKFEWLRQD